MASTTRVRGCPASMMVAPVLAVFAIGVWITSRVDPSSAACDDIGVQI
jgi:hypothetical protein